MNSTALLTFVKALLVILAKKSQDVSGGHFAERCSRPERGGLAAGEVQGCTHLFSPSCRKYTSSTSGAFDMPGYAAPRTPPRLELPDRRSRTERWRAARPQDARARTPRVCSSYWLTWTASYARESSSTLLQLLQKLVWQQGCAILAVLTGHYR